MWGLYGALLAKGQITYANATSENKNFTAIYPEIYPNTNPAGAKTVVRYILREPGTMALYGVPGPTAFDPKDKIYVFSRLYDTFGVDDDHILFLPVIDTNLFYDKGRKRTKTCFYVGHGQETEHPDDWLELSREIISNQSLLADTLNECEVMHSFDPVSAMMEVARLCGCRVVISPSLYTREQFAKYEPGMNGISWGPGESVPLDSREFRRHYLGLRQQFWDKLDLFIKETKNETD